MTAITLHETDQHAHLRSDTAECSGSPDGIFAPTVQLHVEVRLHAQSLLHRDAVTAEITSALINNVSTFRANCTLDLADWWLPAVLRSDVTRVYIGETSQRPDGNLESELISADRIKSFVVHVYRTRVQSAAMLKTLESVSGAEASFNVATITSLPSDDLEDLWENLHFTTQLKESLQHFVDSAMLFSRRGINEHMVTCNRMIFLHGPPGSGKSSLCRALAQKIAVRSAELSVSLIELNACNMFSRWFSESPKMVAGVFEDIISLSQARNSLIFVLIDEVESLTSARRSAQSGVEPSEALRVVNVLLTQLDKIKAQKNVFVMATSNIKDVNDTAFLDRADIIAEIAEPDEGAIYSILCSTLTELMRCELVGAPVHGFRFERLDMLRLALALGETFYSQRVFEIAHVCKDSDNFTSGRALRRLPLVAHSRYIRSPHSCSLRDMLDAMERMVEGDGPKLGTG